MDKVNLTQFGRAMGQLGIEMIPAYSPEARGRSERVFRTHQDRLVKELALNGITDMDEANRYIQESYLAAYNAEFMQPTPEDGSAFVDCRDLHVLDDILCEHHERTVRKDNCVSFEGVLLQIPEEPAPLPLRQGQGQGIAPCRWDTLSSPWTAPVARYDTQGQEIDNELPAAA